MKSGVRFPAGIAHARRVRVGAASVLMCAFALLASEAQPPNLAVETVATGLNKPLFVGSAPGDATRLYILEQTTGKVLLLKNGVMQTKPFLRLANKISNDTVERGLLGMAIHPDYPDKRFIFVDYTDTDGNTVVERYKIRKNRDRARKRKVKPILKIHQPTSIHNAGMLAFGPLDGYLYISCGDGGPANDPQNRAQRLDTLLGKLLRININCGKKRPYRIPATNPFVSNPLARDEIWAYGLRNPWRFSFDRQTGDLYIGDVGQNTFEEVDRQAASSSGGENYGWNVAEGMECRGGGGTCGTNSGFTPPIYAYGRTEGQCVTGGYIYRGAAIPGLQGTYFFADFVQGRVWSFSYDGAIADFTERTSELDPPGSAVLGHISSLGQDASGELYIVSYEGAVFRIVQAP